MKNTDRLKAFAKAGETKTASDKRKQYKQLPRSERPSTNKFGMPAKTKPIMVYLDSEDYEKIRAGCIAMKRPMSHVLRDAALEMIKKHKL
jgi:hypothetical protein